MLRVASVNQDRGVHPTRKKGASVHLLAMRNAFAELGADVVAIDEPEGEQVTRKLERCNRSRPLDIVYERYALGCSAAARFAKMNRIPYVIEVNAPLAEEQARYRGMAETAADQTADRWLFGAADGVLAVSSQVAEYALRRGARQDRLRVVPNAVDPNVFKPRAEGPLAVTPRDGRRVVIGFHGRLRPWHGFERLVRACRKLLDEGAPIGLLAVGEGDFRSLLAPALPRAAWDVVEWQPYPAIAAYVAQFDIVPLCYSGETSCYFSPLKLAEAMACGAVPVVPATGDLPAMVKHGENGVLYPAEDVEALAASIGGLVWDKALRARLSQAASRDARTRTWQSVARVALDFSRAGTAHSAAGSP